MLPITYITFIVGGVMIIDKHSIQLNNQHQLKKQSKETESLRTWQATEQTQATTSPEQLNSTQAVSQTQSVETSQQLSATESLKLQLVKIMVKQFTGHDFKLFSPDELKGDIEAIEFQEPPPSNQGQNEGFGLIYQRTSAYSEQESSSFSAQGKVSTQDGKEIDFSISLNMSRSFYTESSLTIQAGTPEKIDPLVINFEGKAAELSSTRFEFDIDADGSLDQISLLKPSSGFLALDKNNDNVINDGSELFGPQSGNGFSDLAAYDDDANGFIDEADSIYNSLRIWQRHEDGSQQLFALADKEIGAIYLGHASTPYQLKTNDNESLGEISHSGIYISENGEVGTVQQIDFTV